MALFYLQFPSPNIPIVVINLKFERVFGQDGTRLRLDTFLELFLLSKNDKKPMIKLSFWSSKYEMTKNTYRISYNNTRPSINHLSRTIAPLW